LPLILSFCEETKADLAEINNIITRLEHEQTIMFAAENGQICGVAGGYMVGNVGIADFFYVLPEYRKGMVGGLLHRSLTEWVKEHGGQKVAIFCDNERLPIYLKIGYKHKKHIVEREV
jgi:GNAT superfamily N-acetyltransferase